MEKPKMRIEPITRKEAIQRDQRLVEFLTQDDRLRENPIAGNYRNALFQVKESIGTIIRMNLT